MPRWSIIRLIWLRDLRDQLRDRRTLFMIAGLPLLLYPVLGTAVLGLALSFADRPNVIGVVRPAGLPDEFPPRVPPTAGKSLVPPITLLSATPFPSAPIPVVGALALHDASRSLLDYPAFITGTRLTLYDSGARERPSPGNAAPWQVVYLDRVDLDWLAEKKGDVILSCPPDFFVRLEQGEDPFAAGRPLVTIHGREGDPYSRQARERLDDALRTWKQDLKRVRLARRGLPDRYDDPFSIEDPVAAVPQSTVRLSDLMGRLFPFMLVLWSLAGALYPAVDLCAGEKERGTMETLLITPAGREEIVLGKFLTIWMFSAGTSLINLLSMGLTTWFYAARLPLGGLPILALLWCVLLSLPLSAFFSAISLAIGAYARSSKEGQYYLMPLFVVTMPLIFLTLAPGVELNAFYSLVPVTGVALLMQRLTMASAMDSVPMPWLYFAPVLLPIGLYSWLALRWAIEQFNREEVLFREAERWDWGLWLRRLFRDKEPLPTTGEALFCFVLILSLRWVSVSLGTGLRPEAHAIIVSLAFIATPPALMALMLNTLPRDALYLRRPDWKSMGLAAVLALVLLPPLATLAHIAYGWFPQQLSDPHPMAQMLRAIRNAFTPAPNITLGFIAYALAPAICEEIAFRGFILSGLQRHFRARNAILASAFLFALYHLNVFLFVPAFGMGIVLGLLTVRSRSLMPAILFHLLRNTLLLTAAWLSQSGIPTAVEAAWPWVVGVCIGGGVALLWWLYRRPYTLLAQGGPWK